jgi:hypothetical protein
MAISMKDVVARIVFATEVSAGQQLIAAAPTAYGQDESFDEKP